MNALPTPPLVAGPLTAIPSVPQQRHPDAASPARSQAPAPSDRPAPPLYRVSLAVSQEDVRAAQRLRHQVFAGELGARLDGPEPGLDSDAFDAYCDHLLVREVASGDVIATYRLLPPERARIAGRLYAESEFDLGRLDPIRDDLIEVGRSCVHPAHRDGAVIALIWAGLARYMERSGHNWLAGCCSISLADGGVLAADSWDTVGPSTWPPRSTGSPRTVSGSPPSPPAPPEPRPSPVGPPRAPGSPLSRRCSAATFGSAPGSAVRPRTTRTSTSPTSTYCCRCAAPTPAICATSCHSLRWHERLAARGTLHPAHLRRSRRPRARPARPRPCWSREHLRARRRCASGRAAARPGPRDRLIRCGRRGGACLRRTGTGDRPAAAAGRRGAPGELVVANHISWLDIPLVAAVLPGRMLAKSEIRRWPVLGPLAALGGTLFVERDRLRGAARRPCATSRGRCAADPGWWSSPKAAPGAGAEPAAGSGPPRSRPRSTRTSTSARYASPTAPRGRTSRQPAPPPSSGTIRSPPRCGAWSRRPD